MTFAFDTTVRDLASRSLSALRILEAHGIDYCCGGKTSLSEACAKRGLDPDRVLAELEAAEQASQPDEVDWKGQSIATLVDHIVDTHHVYLRRELPQIAARLAKVQNAHGERYPEMLYRLHAVFQGLADELDSHLAKEEQILFPVAKAYEQAAGNKAAAPHACFSTVAQPISMMEYEHDSAGDALREIRSLTNDFQPPADACPGFRALFASLAELEKDLHLHIHLENNVLFPRVMGLESGLR